MSNTHATVSTGASALAVPPEMMESLALIVRIGGVELLTRVTELFKQTAAERLPKLRSACEALDLAQVSKLAHAVKGSAAQVGAEPLRVLAAQLEKDATTMSLDAVRQAVDAIERETDNTHLLLNRVREERGEEKG